MSKMGALKHKVMEDRAARGKEPDPFDDPAIRAEYDEWLLQQAIARVREQKAPDVVR